jgi:hypothetical protein
MRIYTISKIVPAQLVFGIMFRSRNAQALMGCERVDFGKALRAREELDSLNLNVLLLAADAANALPDCAAYAPTRSVAAADAGCFRVGSDGGDDTWGFGVVYAAGAVARGHLYAMVAGTLMVLQGLVDGE